MSTRIKIVVIEDDDTIRDGYAFLIDQVDEYEVVNTYASYEAAAANIAADKPDVILLDIELPGINGVAALPKLKKLLPDCNLLIMTVYDSEKLIFEALANGASGYLTKSTASTRILDSIKEVHEGGGPMSVNIARLVINSFQKTQHSPLSKRETQILELIANGEARGQIAKKLFIDTETVRSHVKKIYAKLEVNSKVDAIKTARENKII